MVTNLFSFSELFSSELNIYLVLDRKELQIFLKTSKLIQVRYQLIPKIQLLINLIKIFKEFTMAIDMKDYSKCNELFAKLANFKNTSNLPFIKSETNSLNLLIEDDTYSDLNQIMVYNELKTEFTVQRERLWYELNIEWDKLLQIDLDPGTNTLFIATSDNINQEYLDILTKFSKYKTNSTLTGTLSFLFISKMKQFCKKFLDFCQSNIISNQCVEEDTLEITCTNGIKRLQVKINLMHNTSTDPAVQLEIKLNLIKQVLVFLNDNFFKLNVFINESDSDVKVTLMSIFSELILNDFVKLIYQRLIISIIPLKNYDCKLETNILQLVNKFEETLHQIKFLNIDNHSSIFNQFVSNVEELYIRKKCKFIMEKSREQMKQKDLIFELVKINEKKSDLKIIHDILDNFELKSKSNKLVNILNELIRSKDSNNSVLDDIELLKFPDCSISKTAKLTTELVYETLNEAFKMVKKSQDIKNISLLCLIARNLFDLYINVIPTYHRENFKDIPLLSAIGYNDFIYLAFNCLTLTHQYKGMFLNMNKTAKMKPLELIDHDEMIQNFSCLDLIPKLCQIGTDLLNKQIEAQQILLMQFLHEDCNGIMELSERNNYDLFTKALQKCNIQLNNLASAWLNVLPVRVYYRIFGRFFNFICNDLLKSSLKLEDISSDDATYLHSALSLVKQSVYDIFSKHQDQIDNNQQETTDFEQIANMTLKSNIADLNATKYVQSWQKFKYLLNILKASLQEIVDLWSDSKGPLALCYEPEEVRHLIRALFMITDRRSAALDKIK